MLCTESNKSSTMLEVSVVPSAFHLSHYIPANLFFSTSSSAPAGPNLDSLPIPEGGWSRIWVDCGLTQAGSLICTTDAAQPIKPLYLDPQFSNKTEVIASVGGSTAKFCALLDGTPSFWVSI